MTSPPTRLRLLRLIHGWTLDAMAARSGVARTTITQALLERDRLTERATLTGDEIRGLLR